MKSSLNPAKKSIAKTFKKTVVFLLVFVTLFSFLITPLNTAQAQSITHDPIKLVWDKITNFFKTVLLKGGATAFQQVLRTALNKIAYDTANYLGSGGKGQKPLFITQDWGAYLLQIGDEAGGQFIESFASNLSKPVNKECQASYQTCTQNCLLAPSAPIEATFDDTPGATPAAEADNSSCIQECKNQVVNCDNKAALSSGNSGGTGGTSSDKSAADFNQASFNVCQPSSLEAKVKIGLGLVEQQRPGAPNCTASEMIQNWGDEAQRLTDFKDPQFLNKFKNIFDPASNDLGIYMSARTDMINKQATVDANSKLNLAANKGWQDKTNIAKKLVGVPGKAESDQKSTDAAQKNSMLRTTGDILVDAANVFLNQYAITKFNDLMGQLGKKSSEGEGESRPDPTNPTTDPSILYGEGNLQEVTSSIIKPDFGISADYDILSQLVICPDPKNPGPTNCVIDDKFLQGVTAKKTVAEAIKDGYIHGDWQMTKDAADSTYSLRNISILRKYRILPIGWEEAINRAFADPAQIKKVTVMDLVSCFDQYDSYNEFSSDFDVTNQTWCRGLVDPNWVLKSSPNYCRKQGASAQVINKIVMPSIPGVSSNPYTPSYLTVTRQDNYCADEQTCIKEKDDGSCEVYGYCNEEKRTWKFAADTCTPIYNTCQSFTNPTTGKNVSYLENTLDYTGCNSESAGCRQYSTFGSYSTSTGTVSWQANKSIYLNKNITSCNSKDEGCTELLRVKPTWGSNLVMDADYNNDEVGASSTGGSLLNTWPYRSSPNSINSSRVATIVETSQEPGGMIGKALKLEVTRVPANNNIVVVGTYSDLTNSLLPENFQLIPGQSYTVSADVFLAEGQTAYLYLGDVNDGFVKSTGVTNQWEHLSVTRAASGSFSEPIFGINADNTSGNNVKVYIKNLKFEVSNFATNFGVYGAYKVYEKLLPPYLEQACYVDITSATKDYRLASDAPAICSQFARKCNRSEVGCELFTNVKNELSVPAQVMSSDYCPSECLGYDVYITKEDHFNSPQLENIIPQASRTCALESAGCSEFTNLDELKQGGEKKEYYTFLKQCIEPSQTLCGNFYSWEGTDSGYQLKAYSLKKTSSGDPEVTDDDSTLCNAEIYNKPLGDPKHDPDCREFYNSAGEVSYHLSSRTITCSENCHAYRMSDKNIDRTLTQAQCESSPSNSHWDASVNVCYVCLNGGTWDTQLNSCIYQAIPGEGKTCNASSNGCREYNGNDGNNVRTLSYYNFEIGLQGWYSNCSDGLALTTVSNNKDGHSVLYNDGANDCAAAEEGNTTSKQPLIKRVFASTNVVAQLKVSSLVTQGKAYNLRFIAKASSDTNVQIYFYNNNSADPKKAHFATSTLVVKGGGDWGIYQTNLENLDHAVTANEILAISGDQNFYFDDVILTEISDRYYLIRGTSQIPDICYYDIFDQYQGADYNLGCSQYTDRNNLSHNLHKFSKLCSDSAVGCEQMIATQNYTPYTSGIWGDTNDNGICDSGEIDCVKVGGDKAIYAVFDSNKQCNAANLGCSRLGQGTLGGTAWSDVYKKNNPNLYDKTLCGQGEVGCEEWKASDGTFNYFRDPENNACQYRASQDITVLGKAWYKIPVKRCDNNENNKIDGDEMTGAVCSANSNCGDKKCIIDTNDYPCSYSYFKTFGLGGAGNQLPVPDQQAGLCEAKSSGCTEFIDPVSRFAPNLIYNPSFEGDGNGWGPLSGEKWNGNNINSDEQIITIEPNKLYIFSTRDTGGTAETRLDSINGIKELLITNNLATTSVNTLIIPAGTKQSIIFASISNTKVKIQGGQSGKQIELKAAVINYQLQENIDRKSCNGVVNFDNGCVLFNERSVNGSLGLASLADKWDAVNSSDKQAPVNCNNNVSGSCSANQLIKVRPDRTCYKWLDCLSYVQDPTTKERTCYAVGQCTRLDDKNDCANFEDVVVDPPTIKFSDLGSNKNASGYYLLNKYHLSNMQEVGFDTTAHYDFEDSAPALSCQRADTGGECVFSKNIVSDLLIREPEKTPTDYPAHGASFLRVPSAYFISPQSGSNSVSLLADREYYINFLVNTKNAGIGARVKITAKDPAKNGEEIDIISRDFYSNNGWSRKIFSFQTGNDSRDIRIYLGTTDKTSDREVYFDDINIEPVLEISGNDQASKQYVSRECRLYPTNDSLTCVNKNNNVLKDGWEGYCLEHDPNNLDVCLLWYPVDQISSTKITRNSSGYQGKFPLNYCTEVNGNFDLVEKRKVKYISGGEVSTNKGHIIFVEPEEEQICWDDGYVAVFYYYWTRGENQHWQVEKWCVPREDSSSIQVRLYTEDEDHCDNPAVWELSVNGHGRDNKNLVPTAEGEWVRGADLPGGACGTRAELRSLNGEGWYKYNGSLSQGEDKNADPAVRVFDYNHVPANEDGLKLLSGTDEEKIYRLTCNNFIQTVDYNGDNVAWAARTGLNSAWPTSTPPYFVDQKASNVFAFYGTSTGSVHSLEKYGRNRQDVPFGSALWPDNYNLLNSEAIRLRNQFSVKNNEEVLAGRPYGCSNYNGVDIGKGCDNIGYCSLDPSVYCIVDKTSITMDVFKKTCSEGGFGTCVPLWSNYLGGLDGNANNPLKDYQMILQNLFLKSYNSYTFSDGAYIPGNLEINQSAEIELCESTRPEASYNSIASSTASFCAIDPKIGNRIVVKYNNQIIATGSPFFVPKKGIYSLEFNTIVDPEQQPLKEIYIKWGEKDTEQLITGQDSRPSVNNPHVFYHYYKETGDTGFKIEIRDNWGRKAEYGGCTVVPNVCLPSVFDILTET